MVPFCEMLNHECSDVYYDFSYNANNPHKKDEADFPAPKEITERDMEQVETSDGSYKSEEEESDSEFEVKYNVKIEDPVKACEDIVESLKKDIKFLS